MCLPVCLVPIAVYLPFFVCVCVHVLMFVYMYIYIYACAYESMRLCTYVRKTKRPDPMYYMGVTVCAIYCDSVIYLYNNM